MKCPTCGQEWIEKGRVHEPEHSSWIRNSLEKVPGGLNCSWCATMLQVMFNDVYNRAENAVTNQFPWDDIEEDPIGPDAFSPEMRDELMRRYRGEKG